MIFLKVVSGPYRQNGPYCVDKPNVETDPTGCPMLTAPPWMLTLDGHKPSFCMFASATTLKASLISNMVTSSCFTPDCENSLGMAKAGAMVKSIGAVAASANAARQNNYNYQQEVQIYTTITIYPS